MSELAKISAVTLMLVLVGLGFFFFTRDEGKSELSQVGIEEEIEVPTESGAVPRRSEGPVPLDVVSTEEAANEGPAAENSEEQAEGAGTRQLKILLLIQDLKDEPLPKSEGSIDLTWEAPSGKQVEKTILFRDNSALFAVPRDLVRLEIKSASLATEKRRLRIKSRKDYLGQSLRNSITVSAELVPRVGLHVLDKLTKKNLKGIRVYLLAHSNLYNDHRPEHFDDSHLIQSGDSPLFVDVLEHGTHAPYWIVAQGYAAQFLYFAPKSEGERTVQLEPCGILEVQVRGNFAGIEAPLSPSFRLRKPKEENSGSEPGALIVSEPCADSGSLVIDNLVPGPYRVSIETGAFWNPGLVLLEQDVRIEVGQRQIVQLDVNTSQLRMKLIEFRARVLAPANGLQLNHSRCLIEVRNGIPDHPTSRFNAALSSIPGRPNEYSVEEQRLAPGPYTLTIGGQTFEFEVQEDQVSEFVFELRSRSALALKLKFQGSDEYIRSADVFWSGNGTNGNATWNEKQESYFLTPSSGTIHLFVTMDTGMQQLEFDYEEGQSALELEVPPGQSFILILKCKGLVIPHSFELAYSLTNDKGERMRSMGTSSNGNRIERFLDTPGNFKIEVTEAPRGYRSKSPVEFELEPGDHKDVIYELLEEQ